MADNCGTVVVAGATGRAGRLIVDELLRKKYRVRALLVKQFDPPEPAGFIKEGVELVFADLSSQASLEQVMEGADFVISAIGSKKPFSAAENDRIDNMGNQNLACATKAKGLKHMVVISSIGAGDSWKAVSLLSKIFMGPILKAKTKSEDAIRAIGISYTIIRPGGYADKELSGKIAFGEGGSFSGRITRKQVVQVCVDALTNPEMKNRTLEVVDAQTAQENLHKFLLIHTNIFND